MTTVTQPVIDVLPADALPVVARRRSRRVRIVVLLIGLLGVLVIAGVVPVGTMAFTCG